MKIYYIGSFPPVYGGVTIKNKNLYEGLSGKIDVHKIDMNRIKKVDIREIVRFGWALFTGKQYIIGLAGQKNRRQFTNFMYRFKRRAMSRSVMMVMGGVVEDMIGAGPEFLKKLGTYRRVFLEYAGMACKLENAGVSNAEVYPNGRPRPQKLEPIRSDAGPLRCVFFSQIEADKGVDRILEAAMLLPDVQFDFYGRIVSSYEMEFEKALLVCPNVRYHGVFGGDSLEVYRELNQYDVLLLPTRCKTEGLPGILIEAKIAGIPAVISGINYTGETVTHGVDGMILQEDTVECLKNTLCTLAEDRELLLRLKEASRISAEQYYIDICASKVIRDLERG